MVWFRSHKIFLHRRSHSSAGMATSGIISTVTQTGIQADQASDSDRPGLSLESQLNSPVPFGYRFRSTRQLSHTITKNRLESEGPDETFSRFRCIELADRSWRAGHLPLSPAPKCRKRQLFSVAADSAPEDESSASSAASTGSVTSAPGSAVSADGTCPSTSDPAVASSG